MQKITPFSYLDDNERSNYRGFSLTSNHNLVPFNVEFDANYRYYVNILPDIRLTDRAKNIKTDATGTRTPQIPTNQNVCFNGSLC